MAPPDAFRSVLARKFVVVGGVLVLANLVLAVVGPALPDPVTFPTREIQLAIDRLDERTSAGCVDLLVTGNSVAAEALSAQRLAEGVGLASGVVSVLPGSIGTVDVDWMNRVTLPRADPGTIVYVASPLMFVPEDIASDYGLGIYTRAIAVRGGGAGDLHRWSIDHLPLMKYRLALADIEGLVDQAEGDVPETYDEVIEAVGWTLEADGHIASTGSWSGSSSFLDRLEEEADRLEGRWRIDRVQVDALADQFRRLDDEGHRVIMVIPPVTADLIDAYPGGPVGFEEYLEAARGLGEGSAPVVIDLSSAAYPDELFRDTHHLNETGSRRLTAEVIAGLQDTEAVSCAEVD